MINTLSIRLDAIAEQLKRIENFSDLEDKRLRDLETLQDILAAELKKSIRVLQDQIQGVYRTLDDLRSDPQTPAGPCNECDRILVTLRETRVSLNGLEAGVEKAIKTTHSSLEPRLAVQDSILYDMARKNFLETGKRMHEILGDVREESAACCRYPENNSNRATAYPEAWQRFYEDVSGPSTALFRDYVDFLHGVATRDASLDEDMGRLADQLILQWGSQVSLTIPAMAEALECTVARIVRLGFRDWSIWALPLVAREVGCVVYAKDTETKQLADLIKTQVKLGNPENHLRDYLADVFATYVMGPAYCFAAIHLQFDPRTGLDHYSDQVFYARLTEVIHNTLVWMSHNNQDDSYHAAVHALRSYLSEALDQAGYKDHLPSNDVAQLRELANRLTVFVQTANRSERIGDHPSDIRRATVIFSTLEWMSRRESDDPYDGIVDTLRTDWGRVLEQAGHAERLSRDEEEQLRGWAEELAEIVKNTSFGSFSNQAWVTAQKLGNEFLRGRDPDASDSPIISGFDALTAVLNGAWLARHKEPDQADSIAEDAKRAIKAVEPRPKPRSRSNTLRSNLPPAAFPGSPRR